MTPTGVFPKSAQPPHIYLTARCIFMCFFYSQIHPNDTSVFESCVSFNTRSKMGFVESGSFYLHKMRRHPQEPGSAHIQSQVGQPGPMDLRTNPGSDLPPLILALKPLFLCPHSVVWMLVCASFCLRGEIKPQSRVRVAASVVFTTLPPMQIESCVPVIWTLP